MILQSEITKKFISDSTSILLKLGQFICNEMTFLFTEFCHIYIDSCKAASLSLGRMDIIFIPINDKVTTIVWLDKSGFVPMSNKQWWTHHLCVKLEASQGFMNIYAFICSSIPGQYLVNLFKTPRTAMPFSPSSMFKAQWLLQSCFMQCLPLPITLVNNVSDKYLPVSPWEQYKGSRHGEFVHGTFIPVIFIADTNEGSVTKRGIFYWNAAEI